MTVAQDVQGTCDERFAALGEAFGERLGNGEELGGALAVVVDGEPVVDLWGGWRDVARTSAWGPDTLVCVFSCTKTVVALAALTLVARGELDLHAPVARYWPEFAAAGKDRVEVRHLLGHTSGLSGWDRPITLPDVYDWESSTARLAAQAPWWEPGTAAAYHAVTYGHLIGEVIRRITGRKPGAFIASEIARPLGADFHLGLDPAEFGRVAELVPVPPPVVDDGTLDPTSVAVRTFTGPALSDPGEFASDAFRRADIGAGSAHATARALATIHAATPAATLEPAFEVQADGVDLALGVPLRWGTGFALPQPATFPFVPEGRSLFWFGAGGSFVLVDPDRRLSAAYVLNKLDPGIASPASAAYLTALFAALDHA
jgi:CubicO group peptidase (beta-lactamase class C family)